MSDITAESLLDAFPYPLRGTERIYALAAIAAEAMMGNINGISALNIYGIIENLPGDLLDVLAYDFKVDWWDPDADINQKRKTLLDAMAVHRTLGTPGAVKTAVKSVFDDADVVEWYDYGGKPYHYKLALDCRETSIDDDQILRLLDRARYYVNLRSVIDAVAFVMHSPARLHFGAGVHKTMKITCRGSLRDNIIYEDELGQMLADESNKLLIDEGE